MTSVGPGHPRNHGRRALRFGKAALATLASAALVAGCANIPDDFAWAPLHNNLSRPVVVRTCYFDDCTRLDFAQKVGAQQTIQLRSSQADTYWYAVYSTSGYRIGCIATLGKLVLVSAARRNICPTKG